MAVLTRAGTLCSHLTAIQFSVLLETRSACLTSCSKCASAIKCIIKFHHIENMCLCSNKCSTLPIENLVNISCLALSPDGNTLISVDQSGRGLLINFHKRVLLSSINFKGSVRWVQFSPDSKYIAVCKGKVVQVWKSPPLVAQFTPFQLLNTFTGHYDDILRITWSKCSRYAFPTHYG